LFACSELGREGKRVMAGAKADEPQPHPPKDQLPNISYCITSPPPWREYFILFRFRSAEK